MYTVHSVQTNLHIYLYTWDIKCRHPTMSLAHFSIYSLCLLPLPRTPLLHFYETDSGKGFARIFFLLNFKRFSEDAILATVVCESDFQFWKPFTQYFVLDNDKRCNPFLGFSLSPNFRAFLRSVEKFLLYRNNWYHEKVLFFCIVMTKNP